METHRVWVGKRNFTGDGEFEVIEFVGERVGIGVDRYDDMRGVNFHVFITENNRVLIYQHEWSLHLDEDSEAFIEEYSNFDEAAEDGFRLVLMNMRITFRAAYTLDEWRAAQRKEGKWKK